MVRQHIDQMIRTRNFKARNERIQTGVLVTSHKGRKVNVERKVGESCQWKATGQYSRGDSCSFIHGSNRGQKAQSSSPAPKAQTQTDGRKPSRGFGLRGESFWIERSESVDRTPTHNTHLCSTVCSQARNAHHALGSSHTDCISSLCA